MTTYQHALIVRSASGAGLQAHGDFLDRPSGNMTGGVDDVVRYLAQVQGDGWHLVTVHTAADDSERYWLRREVTS